MGVSEGHRQLTRAQYLELAQTQPDIWHDPAVAVQQRAGVDEELARMRAGDIIPVFKVLQELVAGLPTPPASILEVGCASGYYLEVLRHGGWQGRYVGVDYSTPLIELARTRYPGVWFQVVDAAALGAAGMAGFDLVISGACLMYQQRWQDGIVELRRASNDYVILHRTPVVLGGTTTYWLKQGYGRPCLEQYFGEGEFVSAIKASGLRIVKQVDLGDGGVFMMRTYLCQKERRDA